MSLKRALYSLFLYSISPFVVLRLLWRSRSNSAYRQRIFERFGFVKLNKQAKPIVWLHAVSVGETNAATPLIEGLLKKYPDHRLLITTTTPTGSERVTRLFSDRVEHCYFPYDLPGVVSRFIKRVKPQILIVVETEIWPNLFSSCHRKNIPIVLINARLSERSTNAYLKIKGLIKETLVNVDTLAVRSQADALSFKKLGAEDQQIVIAGNIKFDFKADQEQIDKGLEWKKQWGKARLVLVAASTHEGEEEILLRIYRKLLENHSDLLLILVPRHPERFESVYELAKNTPNQVERDNVGAVVTTTRRENKVRKRGGVCFSTIKHSQTTTYRAQKHKDDALVNIIIGDSMGEMQSWFATADVVFIGGSLVDVGGHNPLEAIAQSKPVVSGKHMFNFRDLVPELTESGLLTVCETDSHLQESILDLLIAKNKTVVLKAQKIMQQHRGATARLLEIIDDKILK